MANSNQHTGGCLCGAVRYTVNGPLREAIACHCEQCRRTSGHFVVASECDTDDLTIKRQQGLTWYQSSNQAKRGFCHLCGSSLFWKQAERNSISLMAGALDKPTSTTLTQHIFVADKSDYYSLDDGLPQAQQNETPVIPERSNWKGG